MATPGVGPLVKEWRARRRRSQMLFFPADDATRERLLAGADRLEG